MRLPAKLVLYNLQSSGWFYGSNGFNLHPHYADGDLGGLDALIELMDRDRDQYAVQLLERLQTPVSDAQSISHS